ncbi:hypothetical protein D8I24_4027 (plasmid) [Cupriavidus necator H850]|nr:hypothetical protein D8I24_4027 [Cupriavidus necator H850]
MIVLSLQNDTLARRIVFEIKSLHTPVFHEKLFAQLIDTERFSC